MTEDNNTDWVEQLEEDIEDPYAAAIEGLNEVTQVLAERVVDIEKWKNVDNLNSIFLPTSRYDRLRYRRQRTFQLLGCRVSLYGVEIYDGYRPGIEGLSKIDPQMLAPKLDLTPS